MKSLSPSPARDPMAMQLDENKSPEHLAQPNKEVMSGVDKRMPSRSMSCDVGASPMPVNAAPAAVMPPPVPVMPSPINKQALHQVHQEYQALHKEYHTLSIKDKCDFHVYKRYTEPQFLGEGAYGCVWASEDIVTNKKVAIKKVLNLQEMDELDLEGALRELLILKHMRGAQNVVQLQELVAPTEPEASELNHMYMVLEHVDSDLTALIRSGQLALKGPDMIQHISRGLLRGVCALHRSGILHRDLKPRNVLVGKDGQVKVQAPELR
jgi:hypothetical protein